MLMHLHSLIGVFVVRMKKIFSPGYPKCAELDSCLSLRWAHMKSCRNVLLALNFVRCTVLPDAIYKRIY